MKKGALENFVKLNGEHLWFAIFSRTPFLQSTSATATLLRWGTANSVCKTSDEYPLSRNTNLRSTVQTYHFFFGSINFQCMFSLVYTVYCQEQRPEQKVFCKKKVFLKFHKKALLLEPFFNKVAGLTPILKNICQRLLLHCTHTHHSQLLIRFNLHSAPSSSSSLLLLRSSRPEVFYKKSCSQKFHKIHRRTPVPESLFR